MIAAALLLATTLAASRPEVVIPRVPREPGLEEFAAMEPPADLRDHLLRIDGFVQRYPDDGAPSTKRTDVWLGYDDANLYAVFVAFDPEPEKIRARWSRREQIFGDDIVQIMVDTFRDERRAYSFICNPLGVQFDAIWTEQAEFDDSFDTVWRSEGRLTDAGYVVKMAIPFRSLRFPATQEQTWGLLLNRDIPRDNEETFFPRYTPKIQGRLNQTATLKGLAGISPGRNFQFIPYATARRYRVLDEDQAAFVEDRGDLDGGVDAKFVVRDALVFDVTANPDFSQVESDAPQITANRRFEVFYPEKRPFFLENADAFDTPLDLVFTRRIADPSWGGRATGKRDRFGYGALVTDDDAPDARTRAVIARARRDLGRQSSVGLLVTDRVEGDARNTVVAVDSRIKWNDAWVADLQAVRSDDAASDEAFLVDVRRGAEPFLLRLRAKDIGPEFVTRMGFVPRVDVREGLANGEWVFRPGTRLLSVTPQVGFWGVEDHEGLRLDRTTTAGIELEFPRQTRLEVFADRGRTRLRPVDFPALDAPADFPTSWNFLEIASEPSPRGNFEVSWQFGDGVNYVPPEGVPPSSARYDELSAFARFYPSRKLRFDVTWLDSTLDDAATGERVFSNRIVRLKGNLQLDARLSLRLIAQRDTLRPNAARTSLEPLRKTNVDLLASYIVNPWTALYVGWNSDWENVALEDGGSGPTVVRTPTGTRNDGRQLFVKLSYLIRP
ncbi:MAG TPA: DUF5916 domain-containing protein [Candidatus Polarisedimenticolaceae bacterium]